jgi:hypothetical protein
MRMSKSSKQEVVELGSSSSRVSDVSLCQRRYSQRLASHRTRNYLGNKIYGRLSSAVFSMNVFSCSERQLSPDQLLGRVVYMLRLDRTKRLCPHRYRNPGLDGYDDIKHFWVISGLS